MKLQVFVSDPYKRSKPNKLKFVKDYGPTFYQTAEGQTVSGNMYLVKGREKYFIEWAKNNGGFLIVRKGSEDEEGMDRGKIALRKMILNLN